MSKPFTSLLLLWFIGCIVFFIHSEGYAAFQTNSNQWTIKVGNPVGPPGGVTSCPVDGGIITCSSEAHPERSTPQCGHCGVNYPANTTQCSQFYAGTSKAIDVGSGYGTDLKMPSMNGQVLEWAYVGLEQNVSNQGIQKYKAVDPSNGTTYFLQLHHSEPESFAIGTIFKSGQIGAHVCRAICNGVGGAHTHIQIGIIDTSGATRWFDASDHFCRS